MDIKVILNSKEIQNALQTFSKALNIGVWISGPSIEKIDKITPEWGMKKTKKMLKEAGMLMKECKPLRIDLRKRAVREKKVVIELCPLKFYIFVAPIFFEGKLLGFFEGDGAKATPIDENWLRNLKEKQKKYGFDEEKIFEEADDTKFRIISKDEIKAMIDMVLTSIKSYLNMVKEQREFLERVESFYATIKKLSRSIQMLGINAAIESARIGIEGAGFAIVADEIKKIGEEMESHGEMLENYLKDLKMNSESLRT